MTMLMTDVATRDAEISTAHGSDSFRRIAGLGGLGFLLAVVVENVLRAPMPQPGAPLAEIVKYYAERAPQLTLSQGFYAIAIPSLLVFAIGTARVFAAASNEAAGWAWVGGIALAFMTPTFGLVMVLDALLTGTPEALAAGTLTTALLRLKAGVFGINVVPLATGLLGMGMASRAAKIGPRWVSGLAVLGSLLGLASAVRLRAGMEGSPWALLGLGCFVCWLVFLTSTSIGHLRARA